MTWAFHRADTARDPDALVGLMWPDFAMRVDGEMLGFAEASSGLRAFMENLEEFATEWTDLRVVPLTRSTAVSSFLFRDSVVTKSGEILRTAGPTTFVWERRGKAWRLRFVDADHQIIENDG